VISADLRHAVGRAAALAGLSGWVDPGLRPTGRPGQYALSAAFTLGPRPRATAAALAGYLGAEPWIERAEVTGPGYVTVTVTRAALLAVAGRVSAAGPDCARSDALAGVRVAAPAAADPLAAASWEQARAALAAELTARLAAAAGATVAAPPGTERVLLPAEASPDAQSGVSRPRSVPVAGEPDARPHGRATDAAAEPGTGPRRPVTEVAAAVAFAGSDAVTFTLARAIPGQPVRVDPRVIARQVPGNPAYAVRYAHARAASGLRWAAASAGEMASSPVTPVPPDWDTGGYREPIPRETAALLDALGWLPERVAVAARRGRPDEFARYLEDLASTTIAALAAARHPDGAVVRESDRLAGAMAARTGLAAGLGLLGVSAPDRLLTET
jgi:arginyl-tRNA synthetase